MTKRDWVLNWNQASETGPGRAGGKGWNLGRLYRYGFPVPKGGVVSADLYRQVVSRPEIAPLCQALAAVGADDASTPEVVDRLAEVRSAIMQAPLPDGVVETMRERLGEWGLLETPLAVRSSATSEDGREASFAGIHESFLRVRGIDGVVRAIRGCFASLWTPRALTYRRRLGLADSEAACAAVLCEMVGRAGDPDAPPVAAGVAFTCDPRTGRLDLVTISAVRGLADALVGGRVNPEEIAVAATRAHPRVLNRRSPEGEILPDARAVELARWARRVEWALGEGQEPQDIEWVFDGTRFWLVQARPATRVPRLAPNEVKHLPVIWSNANLKDALPGVLTPLSWSMIRPILRHILFTAQHVCDYEVPQGLETVRRFRGRAYFDLTTLAWLMYDSLGVTPREFNVSMGGHQPEIPVPDGDPLKGERGRARRRARLKLLRAVLGLDKRLQREIEEVYEHADRIKGECLARATGKQLRAWLLELEEHTMAYGVTFQLTNNAAGIWQLMLQSALKRAAPKRAGALASALMAGSGAVTSAEQGYRLHTLAECAKNDAEALRYLGSTPRDPHGWRELSEDSPFRREMERFLSDFGHRAVYEGELENPRWNQDPSFILEQVSILHFEGRGDASRSPREAAQAKRRQAEAELAARTRLLRPFVRWLAKRARRSFAMREAAKSAFVALAEPSRCIYMEIGRRMAHERVLERQEDVFYLTWIDIDAYLLGEWDGRGARALVRDRKTLRKHRLEESPPDVIIMDGEGNPVDWAQVGDSAPDGRAPHRSSAPWDKEEKSRGKGGERLAGLPVSAGRAEGPARILRHPSEGRKLRFGDVLVAPSTDPGWTPLFTRASALVMEVGGYHSHGAIVAREYGIPAVANIPGLLETVRDGDIIEVDGDFGRVLLKDRG